MKIFKYTVILLASVFLFGCSPDGPVLPTEVLPPTGVKLSASDASSLTFSWDGVKGASFYTARLENASGELVPGGQTTTRETSIRFANLESNASYKFMVKVKAGELVSEFSAPLSAMTADAGVEPGPGPDPTPEPSTDYAAFKMPSHEDSHGKTLAFPGAEGGGMYTTGGRGGKVIHVTNLNDSGTGSLRAAIEEKGARTIVFDVAGIISLKSALRIKNGDLTIAGQSAPGDGICIRNYSTIVDADNVIIRFVRFRLGDEGPNAGDGEDAIWGRRHERIILDHCSMSWSIDECSSFYGNEFFTMQWCIMTESLKNSIHGKGNHGYGGIWGGKNASFHHNLLANHSSRNPRFDHPNIYENPENPARRGHVDYRCNTVYNWGDNSTYGGEGAWFNMVNNYYKAGPASKDRKYFIDANGIYTSNGTDYGYPYLYLAGNVHSKHADITGDNTLGVYWHDDKTTNPTGNEDRLKSSSMGIEGPSGEDVYTMTQSAEGAFALICEVGGASLRRDVVDERACGDAKSGKATYNDGGNGSKGGLIDTQSAVGGWPEYKAADAELAKVKDSDGDGMPDWFEDQFGLDKAKPADGNAKALDSFGRYTNLEMYLHYLVRDVVERQAKDGTYQKLP